MTGDDTYLFELRKSRRIRSQRAMFWARITGVLLMILVAATFRIEPGLRIALTDTAVSGVLALTSTAVKSPDPLPADPFASGRAAYGDPDLTPQDAAAHPEEASRPRDRVKVNRHWD